MKIIRNSNKDQLIQNTASFILDEIEELAKTKQKIIIGLVGGTSVAKLYSKLSKKDNEAWQKCHFFVLDERYVPITSEESNFKLIKEKLLEPLLKRDQIQDEYIHPMRTELKGEETAKEYSKTFEEYAEKIDVAILSSGEDGHIAGIFPEKEYEEEQAYEYFEDSPKMPPKRLSITPGALAITSNAFILFLGEGKKEALKKLINSKGERTLPQQVIDDIKNVTIITDQINVS
ncbi:6-phosphogluconolactonase [Candidatus Woesearchaeota archaeon]|nr:6-phosphogluconolactonase [Candidatus Woesearchaeota archaeon]MCF7901404.1 6-phosphogluconolactonase [Candidatus Woesearchaeota archaeon]MCF8013722.1 6-phosphogluconolactonase [Candidatus Woesearchaeota archaeon]